MSYIKLGGPPNKVCAYCAFHKCTITVPQMRKKECLKKHCTALIRNENHPVWKNREVSKAKRQERKEREKARWANIKTL